MKLTTKNIVGILTVLVVGLTFVALIADFVTTTKRGPVIWENADNHEEGYYTDDDITGISATLIDLLPLFFVIGLVLATIYFVIH